MKKIIKKNFPNNKKIFLTLGISVFFFLMLTIPAKIFEQKKISEKNTEIKKILTWSIETYKKNYGEYPENLKKIEEMEIISDIDLLTNKKNILYRKNGNGFFLEMLH